MSVQASKGLSVKQPVAPPPPRVAPREGSAGEEKGESAAQEAREQSQKSVGKGNKVNLVA